jgi:hypothetical protein
MQITEAHIDAAIEAARAGHLAGHTYNQLNWCGTSCCVLGFARIEAGVPEINDGPQPDEIVDTPRAQMMTALMHSSDSTVLDAMQAVQADGSIDYSGDLDLRSVTSLPAGVTLSAGGDLDLDSVTSLPAGVTLSAGGDLYLDSLTSLPEGVTLSAGGDLYLYSLKSLPKSLTIGDAVQRVYYRRCLYTRTEFVALIEPAQ